MVARSRIRFVALAAALAVAGACSSSTPTAEREPESGAPGAPGASTAPESTAPDGPDIRFPEADWERVEATTAGFDPAALDQLALDAETAGSSCLVVTRDGAVVDERYWGDAAADVAREAFSVTKSVTSVLVGIARDEAHLRLEQPAADFITEWRDTDAESVSVENLLSNDSGRHWDLATDYRDMTLLEPDKTAFSVGLAQDAAPGEVWAYNNSAIQTLDEVLEAATGEQPAAYAASMLFDRVGMKHSELSTDPAGNTLTFMGLKTTCLDLARFGYLMLRRGTWAGEQIVSREYVEQSTGRSSTPLNAAYGYLWWLNRPGPIATPLLATTGVGDQEIAEGQLVPGAPADVFWALGFNNQIVAVVPSEGIVAVRMGSRPPPDSTFTQAQLTLGVLGALASP